VTNWTDERLRRLFERYNARFWSGALAGWTAEFLSDHSGAFGFCDKNAKRVEIRLETHKSDREVRATLVHEMAHAAVGADHDETWRLEMVRLRKAGAPTDPLDFLVPYDARLFITDFMEYAAGGASWFEACNELAADHIPEPMLHVCERFFRIAQRKRKAGRKPEDQVVTAGKR
jgi:hypothetical protein